MKLVRGGCYLALSQVDGEHKRFGVHRVIRTYVQVTDPLIKATYSKSII